LALPNKFFEFIMTGLCVFSTQIKINLLKAAKDLNGGNKIKKLEEILDKLLNSKQNRV